MSCSAIVTNKSNNPDYPGIQSTVASSIVSFFGVGNLLGSFTYGWVCQFEWVSPIAVNNFTIFSLGVSMFCLPQ